MTWETLTPTGKRTAVYRLRAAGLDVKEIAAELGTTQAAVNNALARAERDRSTAAEKAQLARLRKVCALKARAKELRGYKQIGDEGLGRGVMAAVCLELLARLAEHHHAPPADVVEKPHELHRLHWHSRDPVRSPMGSPAHLVAISAGAGIGIR